MIDLFETVGTWGQVKRAARNTINRNGMGAEPTEKWKRKILLAEHSPIRKLHYVWRWHDLPYWVSVHFVRHKVGIEHYVGTQRTDRTGVAREFTPQNAPVPHECDADAQAMINISRKRLCSQASPETRRAWLDVLEEVKRQDPALASVCVPECIYRGFCPEFESCGYAGSPAWWDALKRYRGEAE